MMRGGTVAHYEYAAMALTGDLRPLAFKGSGVGGRALPDDLGDPGGRQHADRGKTQSYKSLVSLLLD
jgi:hypothetical protein